MAYDLTGYWHGASIKQVGNQVTATPDDPNNPHFKIGVGTLSGNILTMVFSGGAFVQNVSGTVAPDGGSIWWSNGTSWTKKF